ncbi:MAG: hypothetical protein H7328_07880 [Bdellovibrio sp.]|nr:hypothetical protein [Bdellovibrio sp.]
MKKINLLITFLISMTGLVSLSHESHDHDQPLTVQAPKGGAIKSLEETYVEVLVKGKDIKIYLYDKELKPRMVKDFTIKAKIEMPRTKKTEVIKLSANEQYFQASFDGKGIHRYILHLSVKDPKTGHDDQLKFTIEPKK